MRPRLIIGLRALGAVCGSALLLSIPAQAMAQAARRPDQRAWIAGGVGVSSMNSQSTLLAAWYAYGHLAAGVRQTETQTGFMTSGRAAERSFLLGGRVSSGRLSLLAAAGVAHTSGRQSHGEQSGVTSPVAQRTVESLHLEATFALTRVLGLGVAGFHVGGEPPTTYRGFALIVQLGKLR